MNPLSSSQLKRTATQLAIWAGTGLCGVAAALMLGVLCLGDQDTISVYHLQISELAHGVPGSLSEAVQAAANCSVEASIGPGLSSVAVKVDLCGQVQFFYVRQHARRFA
ncbi:hypothetical protein ACO0LO_15555 [Undibacterium sp. TJN25]|uniref:hypothetical protein n=1 Tax=Undibacterium sp. TJN25 TaxID=3413056 RepID=UPI003BF00F89